MKLLLLVLVTLFATTTVVVSQLNGEYAAAAAKFLIDDFLKMYNAAREDVCAELGQDSTTGLTDLTGKIIQKMGKFYEAVGKSLQQMEGDFTVLSSLIMAVSETSQNVSNFSLVCS